MLISKANFSNAFQMRFWAKVDIKGSEDCWLWTASVRTHCNKSYGRFHGGILNGHGFDVPAHVYAFVASGNALLEGMIVCHSRECVSSLCCNPAHLRADTYKANMEDAIAIGTWKKIPDDKRIHRGESHGRALLTEKEVIEIRNSEKSEHTLAREYKVKRGAIHNIKSGTTWKWLKK